MSDDTQEMGAFQYILVNGPDFRDQLHVRFMGWFFNVIAFKWLGISESSYFLPTLIMSCTMGAIGYLLLLSMSYRPLQAFLGGVFLASAPFEVLIGSLRANDLILSWFLALGILLFVVLEEKPVWQGASLAFLAWLGFYVKIWVVYVFPVLGFYYLILLIRRRIWTGPAAFAAISIILHGATLIFWKIRTGTFFPFLNEQGGTYPVPPEHLPFVFKQYPKIIFQGSEFGTTLFGYLPYLLLALLVVKLLMSRIPNRWRPVFKLDRFDLYLALYYLSFFLLLNFFSMSFSFDRYYSAPRIFRYLTPLSFPMTVHLAKMILDIFNGIGPPGSRIRQYGAIAVFAPLWLLNIYQAQEATGPGRIYRHALLSAVNMVKEQSPPRLLTESWVSFFLRTFYLKSELNKIEIVNNNTIYQAKDYEKWLLRIQPALPKGTFLLTGLGSNVHYGGHYDGFRLSQFERPLDSRWRLIGEYGMLSYLPVPEPAALWRWTGGAEPSKRSEPIGAAEFIEPIAQPAAPLKPARVLVSSADAQKLFNEGMRRFDANDYPGAQAYYQKILGKYPGSLQANDAAYFNAICYFRRQEWRAAISEFNRLLKAFPESNWAGGAHYHIGYSHLQLKEKEKARREFQFVIRRYPNDKPLMDMTRAQLKALSP
ncbi:MAG TPA: tetratricopeptide repeat protein [Nitrospiria bacterium]